MKSPSCLETAVPETGARHGGFQGWEPALLRVLLSTQLILDVVGKRGALGRAQYIPSSGHSCIITVRLCTFMLVEKFIGSLSLVCLS